MNIRGLRFTHKTISLKGGEGSGHHGHAGIPGQVGGSAPGGGGTIGGIVSTQTPVSVDATFPSQSHVDAWVRSGNLEYDEEYVLKIDDKVYEVRTEGWWDDCMESRGIGTTSADLISRSFREIMTTEAGWLKADIAGYLSDTIQDPTYGVAYIGREIK